MPESKHRRRRGRAGRGAPGSRRSTTTSLAAARPRKKKTNYIYLAVSALIAVLVIAGFAVGSAGFGLGGHFSQGGSSDQYVEGVGEQQDLMPTANHVAEGQNVEYSTTPPTSGDHWAVWARCGFYDYVIPDERIVHNLEHGNIVVSYNLTSAEEVQRLRNVIDDIGNSRIWGVTRSYDKIPVGTVALAAWGVMDTIQGIDEERIRTFFETYAGNLGPERIPCTQGGVVDPRPAEPSGN